MCVKKTVKWSIDSLMLAESFLRSMAVVDAKARWWPHKKGFLAAPNWAVVEYMLEEEAGICVSVYQGPESFDAPPATLRPSRPGYARFKLTSGDEVNRMFPILLESFRRFMGRAAQAA